MNTQQLRYIIAIAEYESISTASEKLKVSPTTISLYLKKFESEIGAELFHVSGKR